MFNKSAFKNESILEEKPKSKRFWGMLPSDEIEIEKRYRVGEGQLVVTIQAAKSGWTIIYADGGTSYEDKETSSEENFKKAFEVLNTQFDNINEV